ncbi:MAG: antibiotic biosynthesis monooxygenase family protein [Thermoleophilaceae bacterium]
MRNGDTMVVEYIRYRIPQERREEFEGAYGEAAKSLDASEHCLRYELSHGVEEPDNYILRIEWDSLDGHEQGFRRSEEFGPFFAAIKPYVDAIEEMRHYDRTTVAG